MTISHEFVPHLGGPCPQCGEPKRWTLEELREARNGWIESIPAHSESPINDFLDWLAALGEKE